MEFMKPTQPVAAPAARFSKEGKVEVVSEPRAVPRAAPEPSPAIDLNVLRKQIAQRLEQVMRESGRSLEFRVDEDANATVLTVRRADTGEVVRQYPTEQALDLLRRLNEQSGTLLEAFA